MAITPRQEHIKISMLKKIIPTVTQSTGFQQLKMDEIAKLMDVSRATMYKYFSSKEEVVAGIVEILINYIEELKDPSTEDDIASFGRCFQQLFEQSLSSVGMISDDFLRDLELAFPELRDELNRTLDKRNRRILEFYAIGKEKNYFNPINERFILLQDSLLLREITTMKYLLHNQTTMHQVLLDYYQFKKIQLFRPDQIDQVDDTPILPQLEHIADKYSRKFK